MHDLVLGYDHGFGRSRSGDVEAVRRIGTRDGFGGDVVDAVREDGEPISSTGIRAAVAHGDLARAERWLGRPHSLRGAVERGGGRGPPHGAPTPQPAPPEPPK